MKHIKLFEEAYSEIPTMSVEQIKNMSKDQMLMTLRKLAMKGEKSEFSSVARIYLINHHELYNDGDFHEKIGSIMGEYNIDADNIPGVPSDEEFGGLQRDYKQNKEMVDQREKERLKKEYWEKIQTKVQELKDVASVISNNSPQGYLIKQAKDILDDLENIYKQWMS
jgi:hypothetical protein